MGKKQRKLGFGIILISALALGLLIMTLGAFHYADGQYRILSNLAEKMITQYPEEEENIIALIKENSGMYQPVTQEGEHYLSVYGYEASDFISTYFITLFPVVVLFIGLLMALICFCYFYIKKIEKERIEMLTGYLEALNMGNEVGILPAKEDSFSALQDEIYKTVTNLYQTKEEAILVKENYADNLANIAHQMKTPLTSMSLMTQLSKEDSGEEYRTQFQNQIDRLLKLQEALLVLSRIDAGVLELERRDVDVYTLLQLSLEGLEEISAGKPIDVVLENRGEVSYSGDMEWSIEAFSNLIKNCMEYAKRQIQINYRQNPLYTEIAIQDDGEGFDRADIPHVFERFYRGGRAKNGGIGIGLALAKSLIQMQNGCIEAKNLPSGGACFNIRFYRH